MHYKNIKEFKKEKRGPLEQFWLFLKADTWQSWLVSILLIVLFIKLIFFPALSLFTGSSLPLVVIESCSMYHESGFEEWWYKNSERYESKNIAKSEFLSFPYKNGLNKGDIILVIGKEEYNSGEVIIFNAAAAHPLIHRIISFNPLSTKGDHNSNQLNIERSISENAVIGKAALRIPILGWIKLIFFEPFRPAAERGLCR